MTTSTPASPVSIDTLDAEIRKLSSRLSATTYRLLVLARELDDRFGWAQWSFRNGSEWLAWRCGISLSAAREKLRTAHALRRLPLIAAAFEAGRISYTKVRALTRVADPDNEDRLLAYALTADASQVEERCRQIGNVQPGSVHEARQAWERRSLTLWRTPERGTMTLTAELPIEAAEAVLKALDRAIEAGEAAAGPEFEEASWRTQQADALVAIARAYLAGSLRRSESTEADGAVSTADHYQVVVHVDAAALRGVPGAAPSARSAGSEREHAPARPSASEGNRAGSTAGTITDNETIPDENVPLGGGIPPSAAARSAPPRSDLPIEVVRRLTCDGSLVTIVEDAAGKPLNVGRRQRTVPAAIRRALWSRDRGCAFPGCRNTRFVDAHHIRHWSDGGETSIDNTLLLCSHHHRLVHEGGFRIRRNRAGDTWFERADGRVIPRCGYRVDDARPDPVHLKDTSAKAWLADRVKRRKPVAEVREEAAVYHVKRDQIPLIHVATPAPGSGATPTATAWPLPRRRSAP